MLWTEKFFRERLSVGNKPIDRFCRPVVECSVLQHIKIDYIDRKMILSCTYKWFLALNEIGLVTDKINWQFNLVECSLFPPPANVRWKQTSVQLNWGLLNYFSEFFFADEWFLRIWLSAEALFFPKSLFSKNGREITCWLDSFYFNFLTDAISISLFRSHTLLHTNELFFHSRLFSAA